ncbi:hypothetical protein FRC08_003611 [Ceratobasidium sp. 394]|nr:hypothetical protein FRC08_003611 [Ceratobasidium sp. 394]
MAVRRFIAAGLALLVASSVPLVQAQVTSNATCAPQYSWMLNSKQQTPCMASAYLSAQCNDGQWNVPGIGPDGPYNHPNGAGANLCRCNTVVYNLLSACSICQGGNAGNWANWISNCTAGNVTIGHYPLPLPPGAAIPSWAYLDFTSQDMFQVNVAQQYATASECSSARSMGSFLTAS